MATEVELWRAMVLMQGRGWGRSAPHESSRGQGRENLPPRERGWGSNPRRGILGRHFDTQDMLIPNTELKLQIEEFVRSQQSRKRSAAVSEIGEADGADDMAE